MREETFSCYLVLDARGKAVAGGCVWLREEQPGPGFAGGMVPYVMSMYTEERFRRRGLASLVLDRAAVDARKNGHKWMTLHASKAGRKVYPKLGWKRGWEMYLDLD
jgi:GNAT superfamily N-acetyltransferase